MNRYRVPDTIAWVDGTDFDLDADLYLTKLPSGNTVLLKDTARLIWLVAIEGGGGERGRKPGGASGR